jgi:hypothetical protein
MRNSAGGLNTTPLRLKLVSGVSECQGAVSIRFHGELGRKTVCQARQPRVDMTLTGWSLTGSDQAASMEAGVAGSSTGLWRVSKSR